MYHPFKKNSSYLRNAIFKEYKGKCVYCGVKIQPRNMHIDHILPTEPQIIDDEVSDYIQELETDGFVQDSIENYLPACSACNREKSNRVYQTSNLRYFHELARNHVDKLLDRIEKEKENEEYYYEPVDDSIWQQLDFNYQRNIAHAIMGYRLTAADVTSCPEFPQVSLTEKQLSIVDYAMIMGEPGSGKSISLFQIGYHYYLKGWHVYLLNGNNELTSIRLSENTENSLYLIDDAQIYPGYLINDICGQSRPNRKVLLAKTVTDHVRSEDILLTNDVAVNILYDYFIGIKDDILPIVSKCDKTVGANMDDISIEQRLESAKKAKTPWQFTYILRGDWNTIKNTYSSISKSHNLDLLLVTIATFQILNLDKSVDL